MAFQTRNFDTCPHYLPNLPSFALQIQIVLLETHCSRHHRCTCATNLFLHQLRESCLPKTTLEPKLAGGWARGASPKFQDSYNCSAIVEASNFKYGTQLRFGKQPTQKQRLEPKLAGGWAREASQKFWDPLLISATVEASNFKSDTQLGFGKQLTKKQCLAPKLVGLAEHPENLGTPIYFSNH